ncbi:universal stress protein [Nostoc sphaeroides CCNUC1]|uniref:Universal stress protein n=1 Tax=Nostoc sphaeroides CCNUC1 TaxID=2653204 RepID=A0A5P8VS85_9NOSO|nr:universal stress protein [Nostoc sphaeroides CCNUC1]
MGQYFYFFNFIDNQRKWKKYLPKSQVFSRIKKTEFLILDKVELNNYIKFM